MAPHAVLVPCLLTSAVALRSRVAPGAATAGPGAVYRQRLGNLHDMQYFADMVIGGQPLKAILDTGSPELVVFSAQCTSCGIAARYDEGASPTFQRGRSAQVHAYGSGSCDTRDGFDAASVGTVVAAVVPLWVADRCQMPVLSRAAFNAIAGVGPPGQPAHAAERRLRQLEAAERGYRERGEVAPGEVVDQRASAERVLAAARDKRSMLESLGVATFSACLGREPGSPGYMIWNDRRRESIDGVRRVPVAGNFTWSVSLKDWGFHHGHQDKSISCAGGCGAIMDTGTSLLSVPSAMYEAVVSFIQDLGIELDCSDLSKFPDLVMDLGGQRLRLPPSAYLGSYTGQMTGPLEGLIRTAHIGQGGTPCQLLLMDLGPAQQTALGPLVVLGMPFFREYYATFDLGGGRGNRSLLVSPASDSCEPEVEGLVASNAVRRSARNAPRTVDLATVRAPQWLGHGGDVRL